REDRSSRRRRTWLQVRGEFARCKGMRRSAGSGSARSRAQKHGGAKRRLTLRPSALVLVVLFGSAAPRATATATTAAAAIEVAATAAATATEAAAAEAAAGTLFGLVHTDRAAV